jgi:phosphoribosylformylglycinamidine synthase
MQVKIYVTPKKAVLDPQGKAVHAGLQHLGFSKASDVRVGKYLEVALDTTSPAEAEEMARAMCERLLANTVIEDYRIEVDEGAR